MPTDVQFKDKLRRELRTLSLINELLKDEGVATDSLPLRLLAERIEDIQKALED